MLVLKGTHPVEGEISQDFTQNEWATAIAIGKVWRERGWRPRLLNKSWDCQFTWLTSLLSQRKAA